MRNCVSEKNNLGEIWQHQGDQVPMSPFSLAQSLVIHWSLALVVF
jgi:hypothetical protein